MNLLVELSNGDVEEVEVEDVELYYDHFWGNMEAMAEAKDVLLDLQNRCMSITQEVAELKGLVHTKFDMYDTNIARFWQQTMPPLIEDVKDLKEQIQEMEVNEARITTKIGMFIGVLGAVAGAALTALVTSFF